MFCLTVLVACSEPVQDEPRRETPPGETLTEEDRVTQREGLQIALHLRRQKDQFKADPKDLWGNTIWYELRNGTLIAGSSGPDGRRGTADDITLSE